MVDLEGSCGLQSWFPDMLQGNTSRWCPADTWGCESGSPERRWQIPWWWGSRVGNEGCREKRAGQRPPHGVHPEPEQEPEGDAWEGAKEPGTCFAVEVKGGQKAQGDGQTIREDSEDMNRNLIRRVSWHEWRRGEVKCRKLRRICWGTWSCRMIYF